MDTACRSLTPADVAYVRASFLPLERSPEIEAWIAQGFLPRPSYVLPDGTGMVPADHLALVDEAGDATAVPALFAERYRRAAAAADVMDELTEDWAGYLEGTYGICLRRVTPESI